MILSVYTLLSVLTAFLVYVVFIFPTILFNTDLPLTDLISADNILSWIDTFLSNEIETIFENPLSSINLLFRDNPDIFTLTIIYTALMIIAFLMCLDHVLHVIDRFKLITTIIKRSLIPYVDMDGLDNINKTISEAKLPLSLNLCLNLILPSSLASMILSISILTASTGFIFRGILMLTVFAVPFVIYCEARKSYFFLESNMSKFRYEMKWIFKLHALSHVSEGDINAHKKAIVEQIWKRVRYGINRRVIRDQELSELRLFIKKMFWDF